MENATSLIFVYNAHSGLWNSIVESMHKIISPDTYQCALCQITYGTFTELPEWKQFKENFPGEMHFYHIDEFEEKYPAEHSYPVILSEEADGTLASMLNTDRINNLRDLSELIQYCRDWAELHRLTA